MKISKTLHVFGVIVGVAGLVTALVGGFRRRRTGVGAYKGAHTVLFRAAYTDSDLVRGKYRPSRIA